MDRELAGVFSGNTLSVPLYDKKMVTWRNWNECFLEERQHMRRIVFDAYGTLLDLTAIMARVRAVTEDRGEEFLALWRQKQLEYAFLRTIMGRYAPFRQITQDALDYVLERFGLRVNPSERERLVNGWTDAEAFPDAGPALKALRSAGWSPLILSNGDPMMLQASVAHSGLLPLLDDVLSIEDVHRFKPDPRAYQIVLDRYGGTADQVTFVSSNGWDVAGAVAFGFTVFWINRTHTVLEHLNLPPTAQLTSLTELTRQLL